MKNLDVNYWFTSAKCYVTTRIIVEFEWWNIQLRGLNWIGYFLYCTTCGQISIFIKIYEASWQLVLNLQQIINYTWDFSNKFYNIGALWDA